MAKQGQSKRSTRHKERGYAEAVKRSIAISYGTGGILQNYFYWLLDLNCGNGYNKICNGQGSPIVALKELQKQGRKFQTAFCDSDATAITELEDRLGRLGLLPDGHGSNRVWLYPKTNTYCLRTMAEYIKKKDKPKYAVGSVFLDPNATSIKGFSLKEVVSFSNQFPRIDLIVNWNYSQAKRCRGQVVKLLDPTISEFFKKVIVTQLINGQSYLLPREVMSSFNRKHWLVMEPVVYGTGHQFIMLIGRNIQADESGSLVAAESKRGQSILNIVEKDWDNIKETQWLRKMQKRLGSS